MKSIGILLLAFLGLGIYCHGQSPVSHPDSLWNMNSTFSDEFNAQQLDLNKWNNNVRDWGTWSWEPDNAYITDTALTLRMVQSSHRRSNKDFYFTSGIYQVKETVTYGYFETRIKASAKGQGSCPAFWLYSVGQPTPTKEGGVKYCEIDVVEIFQVPNQLSRLEMNLHTRILENGVLVWKRPGQGNTALTHNTWVAPWDPRTEYHTYGVWSRLDSIFWYVDGVQRGAKKNVYWHLPMHPTVSMGLRTPYERYVNGVRTIMPYPDSVPEPGFPTEMFCDYVRVWNTAAQLYADKEKYFDAEFPLGANLEFDCRYFAGNDESVVSDGWNGVTCKLQEIDANGTVVQEIDEVDAGALGKESGLSTFSFPLMGLVKSSELPAGNQYVLRPAFRSSQNIGQDILLEEGYYPITLVSGAGINDLEAKAKIKIISSEDGVFINMENMIDDAQIRVHNITGKQVFSTTTSSRQTHINNAVFSSAGIYVVSVMTDKLRRVEKIIRN